MRREFRDSAAYPGRILKFWRPVDLLSPSGVPRGGVGCEFGLSGRLFPAAASGSHVWLSPSHYFSELRLLVPTVASVSGRSAVSYSRGPQQHVLSIERTSTWGLLKFPRYRFRECVKTPRYREVGIGPAESHPPRLKELSIAPSSGMHEIYVCTFVAHGRALGRRLPYRA